jgi:hypothetical protein
MEARNMDIESFWDLIKKSKRRAKDCEEQSENLTELLTKLEPQEIIDFNRHMKQQLIEAYRWDLWAVAYIIHGGCSDDGFEYFRGWLIAQGRDYFEAALKNPESAAKKVSAGEEAECESILYAASEAYEQGIGSELPPSDIQRPLEPIGQSWKENEVEKLYPKLAKKFG